jgi:hypothetical protein
VLFVGKLTLPNAAPMLSFLAETRVIEDDCDLQTTALE